MRKSQLAFIIIFLCILGVLFYITFDYPKRARNLPFLVISLAMIILIRELIKELSRGRIQASAPNVNLTAGHEAESEKPVKYLIILGWLTGLVLLIWLFGSCLSATLPKSPI